MSEGLKSSSEKELSHLSPTLLTDDSGSPIIPTVIPPKTYAPLNGIDQTEHSSKDPNTASGRSRSQEYFQQHQPQLDDHVERTDHAETPAVEAKQPNSNKGIDRPNLDRAWQTERPQGTFRSASLRNAIHRTPTAGHKSVDDWGVSGVSKYGSNAESASEDDSPSEKEEEASKRRKMGRRQRRKVEREQSYSKMNIGNSHYNSNGKVSKRDGRLNISINETANNGYIAKALGHTFKHHLDVPDRRGNGRSRHNDPEPQRLDTDDHGRLSSGDAASIASSVHDTVSRPRLNIVVMVIGSRGDIQPFLQIGKVLKEYGHRVRIATHPAFKEFVEKDVGLEFFSIGGDPSELMAFMVKNPGLIPSLETVRKGEIARRRNQMAEMFEGFWRACVNATDDDKDKANMKLLGNKAPFVADAIIANPPSYAHLHIAERLGIPLHIMFTFPYSPTQAFPHPLANIRPGQSNVDANYVNFMSYPLVEMMTWQGLGDLVNRFRVKTLGLEPVSSTWGPGALYRMKVPHTYMWSPGLAAKPKDWGPEIDIAGYVFLDLASDYKPPKELTDFLDAGEPPIYIGFGSIVVDDPNKFTKLIFDAVKMAGVRALVSKGWGGIGEGEVPDYIHLLGNTPHDWLFPKCKAVVHHGGAGTTAAGLKVGKPTMVVPFFGDQPFWGSMLARKKAGAHESIPYKKLTTEKLAEGIKQCLTEEARKNAQEIADSIAQEGDGAENVVKSFHRSLPFAGQHSMRCSVLEDRVAVWKLKHSNLRLSALAAEMLIEEKKIQWRDLRLLRHYEWNDFSGPGEPISGVGSALLRTGTGFAKGVGMVPVNMARHIRKREDHDKRKKEKAEKKEQRRQQKEMAKILEKTEKPTGKGKEQRPAGPEHVDTNESAMSADPEDNLAVELAEDIGGGFLQSGGALAGAPLDLGLAIGQGIRNAPRLYGDATVRKPTRITGMHSGGKAARQELLYGIYDGWTGLVTQPLHGWQDAETKHGKLTGLGMGFARGLGGFVLKDISAIITPPFLLAQGVRKEVIKRIGGPGTTGFIRRAQIVQGEKDLQAIRDSDKRDGKHNADKTWKMVDQGWHVMKEVWDAKEHHVQSRGGKIKGRLSVRKEQKRWEENGALENVNATKRALETHKEGKDLEKVFAQRKKEMEIAEQPRLGAMEQPVAYEDGVGVGPNGRYKDRPRPSTNAIDAQHRGNEAAPESTGAIDASGQGEGLKEKDDKKSSLDSDTAVESPDEDNQAAQKRGSIPNEGAKRMDEATHKLDSGLGPNADQTTGRHAVMV